MLGSLDDDEISRALRRIEETRAVRRAGGEVRFQRGFRQPPPQPAPAQQPAQAQDFIEIELMDEEGQPLAGEPYSIRLPDGTVHDDVLDSAGKARLEGIQPGTCQVSFPERDVSAIRPADESADG